MKPLIRQIGVTLATFLAMACAQVSLAAMPDEGTHQLASPPETGALSAKVVTDYTACAGATLPSAPGSPSYTLEVKDPGVVPNSGTFRLTFWRQACRDNPARSVVMMEIAHVSGSPFFTDGLLNITQDGTTYNLLIAARNPQFPVLVYSGVITGRVIAMIVQNPIVSPRFDENRALCVGYLTATGVVQTCLPASTDSGPPAVAIPDVTGMWYRAAESGWGMSIVLGAAPARIPFAVVYVYAGGTPTWFVMPAATWTSSTRFAGELYATSGPDYREGAFDTNQVAVTPVGMLEVNFSSPEEGTLRYSVRQPNGSTVTVTKSIERQLF
ncbi:MAG: hypothetical protein IT368_07755 [Candidatus Hydrogenedentes bacterium]|nr:hypothetical protein [Candidatus Hydrogenedentota bacterium]